VYQHVQEWKEAQNTLSELSIAARDDSKQCLRSAIKNWEREKDERLKSMIMCAALDEAFTHDKVRNFFALLKVALASAHSYKSIGLEICASVLKVEFISKFIVETRVNPSSVAYWCSMQSARKRESFSVCDKPSLTTRVFNALNIGNQLCEKALKHFVLHIATNPIDFRHFALLLKRLCERQMLVRDARMAWWAPPHYVALLQDIVGNEYAGKTTIANSMLLLEAYFAAVEASKHSDFVRKYRRGLDSIERGRFRMTANLAHMDTCDKNYLLWLARRAYGHRRFQTAEKRDVKEGWGEVIKQLERL